MLTFRVSRMAGGASVDRAAAAPRGILGDVRRDDAARASRRQSRACRTPCRRRAYSAASRRHVCRVCSISIAASRSARPSAVVAIASTINPWRFSITTWPRYANRASAALRLPVQLRVRIGLRRMRVVLARVATEIAAVAARWGHLSVESSSGSPTPRSTSRRR